MKNRLHINESKILKNVLLAKLDKWCDLNIKKQPDDYKEKFKTIIENTCIEFSEKQLFKSLNEILKTPVVFIVHTLNEKDETRIKEIFESFIF